MIMAEERRVPETSEEGGVPGTSEEEPLLGQQGDASLPEGKPLYHNLILGESTRSYIPLSPILTQKTGTGIVAQFGAWIVRMTYTYTIIEC